MKQQVLYLDLAKYYDLIYYWKDYKKEVVKLNKIIVRYKKSKGKDLLEVACGTGHHIKYFKKTFSCTGTDINQGMLNIAKKKIKNVTFKKADMVNIKLNKKFDVITCLFSSLGYIKTYQNLKKTLLNFSKHLKPGGVVIIEPWYTKSAYLAGSPHMSTYDGKDLKISRLVVSKVKGNISIMDMHYLIAEKNKEVKHFIDRHEMGLFEIDKTLQFMKLAGLKSKFIKNGLMKGRGLFVGIKELK
ncbi:class I SAM-dependent methyltransferase [Candidatus Woesearchaeota archaeon]|jgi:ubiquinone/menaquinone biosynthesis C-methylase UbiE|nr:class I SAM-dependent methyltransferase [Candidatus Woesearchaeota archaeon]